MSAPSFSLDLAHAERILPRYAGEGPRYTSYPTAPVWGEEVGPAQVREELGRRDIDPGDGLSLYVHVPFCESLCHFCACNKLVTRNRDLAAAYLDTLEREVAAISRKVARRVAEGDSALVRVTPGSVHRFIGAPKILPEERLEKDAVGISTGLAWTATGGDVLFVEATTMKGKGRLILTGHLGEVMKESAQAALSYARSRARTWGIRDEFFGNHDLHVHVPEGAIPKDGPSAGITMATALVSAFTGRAVRSSVAMTGEITLRGHVLPIGGLKEKILAARRAGIDTIVCPKLNKKDLDEVPALLEAVGEAVVRAFGLAEGNVVVLFEPADPDRMFWG